MTPINRSFAYNFKNRTLLRLRVRWNGNEIFLSTGYTVKREMWDGSRCKPNSSHGTAKIPASSINRALEILEDTVNSVFYDFEMANHAPSKEEMRQAVDVALGRKTVTLESAWLEFIRDGEQKKQWAFNTVKSIRQVRNLLSAFRPSLEFRDITTGLLDEFVAYQTKHKLSKASFKTGDGGYANNVIQKNCRILKWFLRWATTKGYLRPEIEKSFSPDLKAITRPVIFLTWDELMKVYTLDLSGDTELEHTRDLFCFCSFTSLRYSDAVALQKSQVFENHIAITTVKTSSNLMIDLNRYSREILSHYKTTPGFRALPFVTNCRMNVLLKRIGKMAGIDETVTVSQYYGAERRVRIIPKYELLSTHCGRRTFICNALALGIAPHIVMKWTGHSEYSAMKPYIDVADAIRKESMKKFDEAGNP